MYLKPCSPTLRRVRERYFGSLSRGAVAERVAGLALGRRIDVQVDDADAAFFQHIDAARDRGSDVGRLGHRPDADGALRLGELGDVGHRILQPQADPAVLDLAAAGERPALLV